MDILTGKVKEPKRNRRAVTSKSYKDPFKKIDRDRLNKRFINEDTLLTAAEVETKAIIS
jgi:hypothetical protein